ncbi:MAG: VOC family protein [Pseudomonadota bacterium]
MIGYAVVGTNDLERAKAFFEALLAPYGVKRMMDTARNCIWSAGRGQPMLGVNTPFDGEEACVGNGTMVALAADTREQVDEIYKKALELGGTDEGAPGERFAGFYAGYFRDLDGNKFNVFKMG